MTWLSTTGQPSQRNWTTVFSDHKDRRDHMDLNLKDRVAVVTGGGSGIGQGIARALAAEGCKLHIWDRDASAAQKAAASLTATGVIAQSTAVDVGDPSAVERAFAETLARNGRLSSWPHVVGKVHIKWVLIVHHGRP